MVATASDPIDLTMVEDDIHDLKVVGRGTSNNILMEGSLAGVPEWLHGKSKEELRLMLEEREIKRALMYGSK